MKTDQIQLRRILLVIETGRCYEYKGEYYEHLGMTNVFAYKDAFGKAIFMIHEKVIRIGEENPSQKELVFPRRLFNRNFNYVKDPQKVMQEFGAINSKQKIT